MAEVEAPRSAFVDDEVPGKYRKSLERAAGETWHARAFFRTHAG